MRLTCRSVRERSYAVHFEWNAIDRCGGILEVNELKGPFYVISDENVWTAHGERLKKGLHPYECRVLLVRAGERSKSLRQWKRIQNFLLREGASRRSCVIAFGGGVIGDLTGFSASTFMRGLKFVQMPTTILSQSDSSIGAKVAINHPLAKNLIGSFFQPALVITDSSLLATLPTREFSAGLGEAIKYGVIADAALFESLYRDIDRILSFNRELMEHLIIRCIEIKIRVVEEDEEETGLRKILNFGHTIGHALEQATGFTRLRHGEAVAWGMLAAGHIAANRKMWASTEFDKLQSIVIRGKCLYPLGDLNEEQIVAALRHDKKKSGTALNFVLPEKTGKVRIVQDVQPQEISAAIAFILSFGI